MGVLALILEMKSFQDDRFACLVIRRALALKIFQAFKFVFVGYCLKRFKLFLHSSLHHGFFFLKEFVEFFRIHWSDISIGVSVKESIGSSEFSKLSNINFSWQRILMFCCC